MVEFCVRRRLFNVYRRESPGSVGLLPQERLVQERTEHFALSGLSVTCCIYSFIYLFILLLTPRERGKRVRLFIAWNTLSTTAHRTFYEAVRSVTFILWSSFFLAVLLLYLWWNPAQQFTLYSPCFVDLLPCAYLTLSCICTLPSPAYRSVSHRGPGETTCVYKLHRGTTKQRGGFFLDRRFSQAR